jgi:hypothetical protein
MPPPPKANKVNKEGLILLAIQAFKSGQKKSIYAAATAYGVPDKTLRRRIAGTQSRRDCQPNSKKLTENEEEAIIEHIIELDQRGFSPSYAGVADMANYLLAARGGSTAATVGKQWPYNFVQRSSRLQARFNRRLDYKRAQCEDPEVINGWFRLVQNTIAKYGITEADIYNFDETGFQMGVIMTAKVVTGSDRSSRPKAVQPGNREWVTIIQGIGGAGYALPPFIVFAGKHHLSTWYEEDTPPGSVIAVSDNGWTTNKIGLDWIHHFDQHTKDQVQGTHRLLIIDGHKSHQSIEFELYCKEQRIITLCMPPHSSHLLQPLDVGCFAPLKRAYSHQIQTMMKHQINHISKLEFLPAFKAAFFSAITPSNIQGGFRGSGLIPLDPDAVLEKLSLRFHTPSPPPIDAATWASKTPKTAAEIGLQSAFLERRIQCHQNSSPSSIIDALNQFTKGAQLIASSTTLIKGQIQALEDANRALTARKKRRKKMIQRGGTLTAAQGINIIAQSQVDEQIEAEIQQNRPTGGGGGGRGYRCSGCYELGHRINQCPQR